MYRCVWALVDEEITEHMTLTANGDARAWLVTMISTLKNDEKVKIFVTLGRYGMRVGKLYMNKCTKALCRCISLWRISSLILGMAKNK
jgi:hypothetical protein